MQQPTRIKIIDGQQRLTTSMIFLCAVRDTLKTKFKRNPNEVETLKDIFNDETRLKILFLTLVVVKKKIIILMK